MTPQGKCPTCGQLIGSKPGEQTPVHSVRDNPNKACAGGVTKPL